MHVFVIKSIRKKKKLSLYQLSNMTGISRTYLRNLENNKNFNPTFAVLEKIANALEVHVKDLFFFTEDIEDLKKEMYHRIDIYGICSEEALEISHIIDLLVNLKMKKD